MDRRYKQARFYNGTPATDRSVNKSDSLVRSYLAKARKQNATDQSYGGSTGGRSSISSAQSIAQQRGAETPIETRYLTKKVAACMEPVVRNTNLGSFLIWGLEIRRNISFDKV